MAVPAWPPLKGTRRGDGGISDDADDDDDGDEAPRDDCKTAAAEFIAFAMVLVKLLLLLMGALEVLIRDGVGWRA